MIQNNFYVLSGAMGAGKSAILSRLSRFDVHCVPEPARQILAEQRLIRATGVPEKNAELFSMLMLSRSIHNYYEKSSMAEPVIFDRGIPDMLAYARLFTLDEAAYINAAMEFKYNPMVFYFPGWEDIYSTDTERRMSFEQAKAFGQDVRSVYEGFGYQIVEVPRCSMEGRVQFIMERISYP